MATVTVAPAITVAVDAVARLPFALVPRELRRRFEADLTLPNPAFVAAQRQGRWTGHLVPTVTLYRLEGEEIILPRGYIPKAAALLRKAGVQVAFADRRLTLPPVSLRFSGTLLPYQERAVEAGLRSSGILVAPPGSGKTVMGLAIAAKLGQPALWLAHTKELAAQAVERARTFLGIEAGIIGDGQWQPRDLLTVGLVQTLVRRWDATLQLARQVGLVIVDEAHHVPAVTFLDVVGVFPAARRLGLTATPHRQDGLWPFAEATIGPVLHRVTTADLERAGRLVRPKLVWVPTDFEAGFWGDWHALMDALVSDDRRNQLVVNLVAQEAKAGHSCLVLSERVAHCEALADMLRNILGAQAVAVLTGSVPKKDRIRAVEGLRSGSVRVLLATKLADEGLDLPALDRLFVVTPRRAATKVLQQVGRVMRPAPGKGTPIIFDLRDERVGVLEAQAKARWFQAYRGLVAGEEVLQEF